MKNKLMSMLACSLLIVFSFVSNAFAQNGWTTAMPMTSPRYGTATGVIDGKIYVMGGHDTAYLNTLEVYDPAMNTWTTLAPLPAVRYQPFAAVIGGKLYVAGGTDGSIVAATLFVYDPMTNAWSTLAPLPTARYLATGGVINGKLYVAGGFVPGIITSTNKLEVYDPATNTWETKTPMPNGGRYGAGGAVFTNKLYVAGGSGFSLGRTKILEVYDPLTDSWTAKAAMPQIQFNIGAGAGALDGQLYTIGGETVDNPNANIVQVYDPTTDKWSTAPVLPTARVALSAGVVGSSIYVFGGYNGTTAVATHEVFTPPSCAATPAGVVGWWSGDGDARDNTGMNNGTPQPTAGFNVGFVGQTFTFNGQSDSYINVPDNNSLEMTSQFTLAAWIRPDDVSSHRQIISKDSDTPNRSYQFGLSPNGGLRAGISADGAAVSALAAPDNSITPGVWQHVAATFNAGSLKLYVNGVEVASGTSGVTSIYSNGTAPLNIGRASYGLNQVVIGSLDEAMVFNRALSAGEIGDIFAPGKRGMCKSAATNAGVNSQTIVGDQTITFQNATTAGVTTSQSIPAASPGDLPAGFTHTGLAYDISTTATFTGNILPCFHIPSVNDAFIFSRLKVMHWEGGMVVNRTTSTNFATRTLCGSVTSLTPFAIANGLSPTAAGVSVGGRVLTSDGRGIAKVRITLIDSGGNVRSVLSNPFGYYAFDEVQAGETYVLTVSSKRYRFTNSTRVISVGDELTNVDFTALP